MSRPISPKHVRQTKMAWVTEEKERRHTLKITTGLLVPAKRRHARRTSHTAWRCSSYEQTDCSPETLSNGFSSSMDLPSRSPESTRW